MPVVIVIATDVCHSMKEESGVFRVFVRRVNVVQMTFVKNHCDAKHIFISRQNQSSDPGFIS